jgi:hypothetical protein
MVVYQHRRLDNNSIFYIGIGGKSRPHSKCKRSPHWNSIVNKYGYEVDIILSDLSPEEAKAWEVYLIKLHGKRNDKTGNLVNISDGGESASGVKRSEEFKKRISEIHKGKVLSTDTRRKLSEMRMGEKHPNWGKKRPEFAAKISKKVIDTITGHIYNSAKEAAEANGVKYRTMTQWLAGERKNKSTLKYLNS